MQCMYSTFVMLMLQIEFLNTIFMIHDMRIFSDGVIKIEDVRKLSTRL